MHNIWLSYHYQRFQQLVSGISTFWPSFLLTGWDYWSLNLFPLDRFIIKYSDFLNKCKMITIKRSNTIEMLKNYFIGITSKSGELCVKWLSTLRFLDSHFKQDKYQSQSLFGQISCVWVGWWIVTNGSSDWFLNNRYDLILLPNGFLAEANGGCLHQLGRTLRSGDEIY